MKIALLAVTENGAALAVKIARHFEASIFVKAGRCPSGDVAMPLIKFNSLKELTAAIFSQYDGLVFIMAVGITVRMIAPYIVHKAVDPAVVVLDERACHAISLLSGHIGGGNYLTLQIADIVGAQPVITTATDINDKLAADVIAIQMGLRIKNLPQIKQINADLLHGKKVEFLIDLDLPKAAWYYGELTKRKLTAAIINFPLRDVLTSSAVILTEKKLLPADNILILQPGRLTAGIGCRKNVSLAEIIFALREACTTVGKTLDDIVSLASTVVKREESGLLAAAKYLNVPIYFYENEIIQTTIEKYNLASSDFVIKQIGVGNICESTAIISSQAKKLVLRKTKYPKVTVALAWEQ